MASDRCKKCIYGEYKPSINIKAFVLTCNVKKCKYEPREEYKDGRDKNDRA